MICSNNRNKIRSSRGSSSAPGFSLLELLAVIVIVGMLIAIGVPAFQAIGRGANVAASAQQVADVWAAARTTATARNRQVLVRIYHVEETAGDNNPGFRAFRTFLIETDGSLLPLARTTFLPRGLVMLDSGTHSPLLHRTRPDPGDPPIEDDNDPLYNSMTQTFRFRTDGSTDLTSTNAWFLTVQQERASAPGVLADNWAVIQVDPANGKVQVHRPQ